MLRNCDSTPSFTDARQTIDPASRYTQGTAASRPAAITLATIYGALRDGLAAHRRYERLRSRGVPHETAIRKALDVCPTPIEHKGRNCTEWLRTQYPRTGR